MAQTSLLQERDRADEMVSSYMALLADYRARMSPSDADKYLHKRNNTIRGAIERREIRFYRNGTRYEVTPMALAEWLQRCEVPVEPDPLPSTRVTRVAGCPDTPFRG